MPADIVLERNSTRVVDTLDIATGPSRSPEVTIDPSNASVSAGEAILRRFALTQSGDDVVKGVAERGGGRLDVLSADSDARIRLTATGSNGELSMDSANGAEDVVSINATNGNGEVSLKTPLNSDPVTITADTTSDYLTGGGGMVLRHKRTNNKQVTAVTKDPSGGLVTVHSEGGKRTCSLDGDDAALVLAGLPEQNRGDQMDPSFGGGELVLQRGVDTPDIQLHAKGERDSDYGNEGPNNQQPRILLDCPEATAELGRPTQSPEAEAVSGSLHLRGLKNQADRPLFEANAVDEDAKRRNGWRRGEAIFRFSPKDRDFVLDRGGGAIRAFKNGLMLYAGGEKVLFVKDNGDVLVRGQVKTGQKGNMP